MDDTVLMHSTSLYGGSGQQKDPLSFLTHPTTDLHLPPHQYCSNGIVTDQEMQKQKKTELQKQKKREADRRYRLKKKKTVTETEYKLAMSTIENDNLKCTVEELRRENIRLKMQLRLETIYDDLEKEIEYTRIENEFTECALNDPNICNMVKVIKENEELKRTIERKEAIIAG